VSIWANAATDGAGQVLRDVWQEHLHSEFVMKDAKAALATMSDDPYVLAVPIAAGGRDGTESTTFTTTSFSFRSPLTLRLNRFRKLPEKTSLLTRLFTGLGKSRRCR
jgi:hypothetical protein